MILKITSRRAKRYLRGYLRNNLSDLHSSDVASTSASSQSTFSHLPLATSSAPHSSPQTLEKESKKRKQPGEASTSEEPEVKMAIKNRPRRDVKKTQQ